MLEEVKVMELEKRILELEKKIATLEVELQERQKGISNVKYLEIFQEKLLSEHQLTYE